ncbi:MAG: ABC transporter substrate-binding protein [Synergistaceae bacterium]|nr:ABC transporter substrate-binding protein [Synergistaceae bacterium]
MKTRTHIAIVIPVLIALLAGLAGSAVKVDAAGAPSQEPIRIGTLESVTGPPAYVGDKMKKGAELAVEEINNAGGINGRPIEWFFYDPAGDTETAVIQTRRLIDVNKVDAIVGGGSQSGIAIAMAQIAEETKTIFIATEGAREIVKPSDGKLRKYVFKATINDTEIAAKTLEYWKGQGVAKVGFLPDNTGFGQPALQAMEEQAPDHGITLFVETFDTSVTDLTPQLSKLAQEKPQAYFAWTASPAGVVFLKNAKQLGLSENAIIQNCFGFADERFMEQAGDAAIGTFVTAPKLPVYDELADSDPVKESAGKFVETYRAKFNEAPNLYAAESYDGIYLVAEAFKRAGSTEPDAVARELESLKDFSGAQGKFSFSSEKHDGLSASEAAVMKWDGTRFTFVE